MAYVLGEDSTVSEVVVDDVTVTKEGVGDPVDLTEDQVNRASAIEGVELVEAGSAPAGSEPDEEDEE